MRRQLFWTALVAACAAARPVAADPVVELTIDNRPVQGMSVVHNQQWCWLAHPDGKYELIDLTRVTGFRQASPVFRSLRPAQMEAQVKSEFNRDYEVVTRGEYVVCAPRGRALEYAQLMADVAAKFRSYFGKQGWRLEAPPFPLVVVVFPDRSTFVQNCEERGQPVTDEIRGFYQPLTNRVWLYDGGNGPPARGEAMPLSRETAVHEGIHQLAFNSGLHARTAANPRWVVEGLATMLEAGSLDAKGGGDASGRVNAERLSNFHEFRARRRQLTIAEFIAEDARLLGENPVDFYSEAWALTFFLTETRRGDYIRFLKLVASHDPLSGEYDASDRLQDFQDVFGKDLKRLEVQYLRFIDGLAATPVAAGTR